MLMVGRWELFKSVFRYGVVVGTEVLACWVVWFE